MKRILAVIAFLALFSTSGYALTINTVCFRDGTCFKIGNTSDIIQLINGTYVNNTNITNITNVTGGGANVTNTTCGAGNHVFAINNATGAVTCTADTAGAETDPYWTANYTALNASWSATGGNTTEQIFAAVNNNTFLKTYTETDPKFTANFSLFNPFYNQTTPAIAYVNSNPFGWINYTTGNTTAQIFAVCNNNTFLKAEVDPYWTANYTALNASWSLDTTGGNTTEQIFAVCNNNTFIKAEIDPYWTANYSALNASWSSTYNATYAAGSNSSWNESYADSKYALQGQGADNSSWNQSMAYGIFVNITYYNTNPFGYVNSSYNATYDAKVSYNTSFNETRTDALYSAKGEPLWSGNYSALNASWSSTYNSTYAGLNSSNLTWNETRANALYISIFNTSIVLASATNISNQTLFFGGQQSHFYINTTNSSIAYKSVTNISNDTLFLGGIAASSFAQKSTTNISNQTLFFGGQQSNYFINTTNTSVINNATFNETRTDALYVAKGNTTLALTNRNNDFTAGQNITGGNLTLNTTGNGIVFVNTTMAKSFCIYSNNTFLTISSEC